MAHVSCDPVVTSAVTCGLVFFCCDKYHGGPLTTQLHVNDDESVLLAHTLSKFRLGPEETCKQSVAKADKLMDQLNTVYSFSWLE